MIEKLRSQVKVAKQSGGNKVVNLNKKENNNG